ncbi:MAG: Rrf2 family transcriptional regulator [bacterium]
MRISFKGDYALKAMVDLAAHYPKLVHVEDIAKRQDIPLKFLEQIILELKKGDFVKSKKGPGGGYILAKDPAKIFLGPVIEFIDGPMEPITCVSRHGKTHCDYAKCCCLYDVFKDIGDYIRGKVDGLSFRELTLKQGKKEKEYLDFSI